MLTFPPLDVFLLLRVLSSHVLPAHVPVVSASPAQDAVSVSTCHSDALYSQNQPAGIFTGIQSISN